ncbi:MAG: PqiC family protein [Candidatus Omnitrophica bacterium]|nr:PqiC family protein [Candidatus Omnitrophota bacterium]
MNMVLLTSVASPARLMTSAKWTALCLVLFAGGCAFLKPAQSETQYYLLSSTSLAAPPGNTNTIPASFEVRLRPIEAADYLQTKDIAVRTGTNEIHFALFHRWAEPIDAGVGRVLAENLQSSTLIRNVLTDRAVPTDRQAYTFYIRVLAFEGNVNGHRGSASFEAAWELAGPSLQVLANGVFRAPPTVWNPDRYGQLAHQLSSALGDFSRFLLEVMITHAAPASPPQASPGGA